MITLKNLLEITLTKPSLVKVHLHIPADDLERYEKILDNLVGKYNGKFYNSVYTYSNNTKYTYVFPSRDITNEFENELYQMPEFDKINIDIDDPDDM